MEDCDLENYCATLNLSAAALRRKWAADLVSVDHRRKRTSGLQCGCTWTKMEEECCKAEPNLESDLEYKPPSPANHKHYELTA